MLSAPRRRSPELPMIPFFIALRSNAIVGIPAVFPVAFAIILFAVPGETIT
jgi:hypothetical protein